MNLPPAINAYIQHIMPKLDGWCSAEKAASLAREVLNRRPLNCCEIGVFGGRSLVVVALALRELGAGRIYGIDPWSKDASTEGFPSDDANHRWWSELNHEAIYRGCRAWIDGLGIADYVELIRDTSEGALGQMQRVGELGFLHIDGNHSELLSVYDVTNYVPLVQPGGSVFFDDTDWLTTKQAQRQLVELCEPVVQIGTCGLFHRKESEPSLTSLTDDLS